MKEAPVRRWLSIRQAAEYFQLAPKTMYSLCGRNRLPEGSILRIGRQLRLDVSKIEAGAALHGKKSK
jgi:hypothetical protein